MGLTRSPIPSIVGAPSVPISSLYLSLSLSFCRNTFLGAFSSGATFVSALKVLLELYRPSGSNSYANPSVSTNGPVAVSEGALVLLIRCSTLDYAKRNALVSLLCNVVSHDWSIPVLFVLFRNQPVGKRYQLQRGLAFHFCERRLSRGFIPYEAESGQGSSIFQKVL